MIKVEEVGVVVEMLRARASTNPRSLVVVDGLTGSGKSTLARVLASAVPAARVSVDSFVEGNRGTYLAHVRIPELREHIEDKLNSGDVVLLDGICCAAVLERLALNADLRIYVARLDDRGEWIDGELFTRGVTEDQAIEEEESLVSALGESISDLRREIIHYHFAFRPWERADVIYQHRDALEPYR